MSLDINIEVINNATQIIFRDSTGAYNVITNPGGWGTPNSERTDLTDSDCVATSPTGEVFASFDLGNFMTTTSDLDFLVSSTLENSDGTYSDGVWKFDFTFVGISQTTLTVYALRDIAIKARLARLALGSLDKITFEPLWLAYEKMKLAFDAGDYTLCDELMSDIDDMLNTDTYVNCGC